MSENAEEAVATEATVTWSTEPGAWKWHKGSRFWQVGTLLSLLGFYLAFSWGPSMLQAWLVPVGLLLAGAGVNNWQERR